MKYSSFFVAIAAALSSHSVLAWAPEGYNETDIAWVFKDPKGKEITLIGTIEEVTAEYEALFPGEKPKTSKREEPLEWAGANYECIENSHPRFGWKPADYGRISEGWNYLWDHGGKPKSPAAAQDGTAFCGRVSCSHNAGIYWCNDNKKEVTLNSWSDIARGAAELCNACSSAGIRNKCGGQIFHAQNFNVMIREDKC